MSEVDKMFFDGSCILFTAEMIQIHQFTGTNSNQLYLNKVNLIQSNELDSFFLFTNHSAAFDSMIRFKFVKLQV